MTELSKTVSRLTNATRHEKSKRRRIILSLEPDRLVAVRLQGTRQSYRLDAESIYELAVRSHENQVERRAKAIKRESPHLRLGQARVKARKELAAELKS